MQGLEIDQYCHGEQEIALRGSVVAKEFSDNTEFLQVSNDMLHQDPGLVDPRSAWVSDPAEI